VIYIRDNWKKKLENPTRKVSVSKLKTVLLQTNIKKERRSTFENLVFGIVLLDKLKRNYEEKRDILFHLYSKAINEINFYKFAW